MSTPTQNGLRKRAQIRAYCNVNEDYVLQIKRPKRYQAVLKICESEVRGRTQGRPSDNIIMWGPAHGISDFPTPPDSAVR